MIVDSPHTTDPEESVDPLIDIPVSNTDNYLDITEENETDGTPVKKVGIMLSVWNLINDIMTPATISIAYYVAQCGLISSLFLLLLFAAVTTYTLRLLFDLSIELKTKSLPDLCSHSFGKPGYMVASFCIFTFNFGGVLISTLMLGELIPSLIRDYLGINYFLLDRAAVMCYLTAVMLPITMRKKLSGFAITSFISVSTLFVIGLLVMYRALIDRGTIPSSDKIVMASPNVIAALGGLSYTYVF
jgi:sodium-coupled neutral amino acid transporter 11